MAIRHPPGRRRAVSYPESDGMPVGETEVHFDEIVRLFQTIRACFATVPDVHVSSDLFVYYEEGNRKARIAPDIMVVRGIPKLPRRRVYLLWEEKPPTVIFEVTSKSSRTRDQVFKRELHARLGVREYYLYDPLGEHLRPPFQALVLDGDVYRPLEPEADGSVVSEGLGMRLRLVDGQLQLFDGLTGAPLLSPDERTELEIQRAEAEARRADAAERRVAELERRLAERGRNGDQADGGRRA